VNVQDLFCGLTQFQVLKGGSGSAELSGYYPEADKAEISTKSALAHKLAGRSALLRP
jgi:hypothetical protein